MYVIINCTHCKLLTDFYVQSIKAHPESQYLSLLKCMRDSLSCFSVWQVSLATSIPLHESTTGWTVSSAVTQTLIHSRTYSRIFLARWGEKHLTSNVSFTELEIPGASQSSDLEMWLLWAHCRYTMDEGPPRHPPSCLCQVLPAQQA